MKFTCFNHVRRETNWHIQASIGKHPERGFPSRDCNQSIYIQQKEKTEPRFWKSILVRPSKHTNPKNSCWKQTNNDNNNKNTRKKAWTESSYWLQKMKIWLLILPKLYSLDATDHIGRTMWDAIWEMALKLHQSHASLSVCFTQLPSQPCRWEPHIPPSHAQKNIRQVQLPAKSQDRDPFPRNYRVVPPGRWLMQSFSSPQLTRRILQQMWLERGKKKIDKFIQNLTDLSINSYRALSSTSLLQSPKISFQLDSVSCVYFLSENSLTNAS